MFVESFALLPEESIVETVPIVTTERLVLRAHGPADFPACSAMWADPAIVREISGTPFSATETWAKMLRYRGLWAMLDYGYWAIEERASGTFIGEVGFADFKRDLDPSLAGRPEMGWIVASATHGRGYATEAVAAALDWGDRHLASAETACIIAPRNVLSLRVAARAGFREFARTQMNGSALIMFKRPARHPTDQIGGDQIG